MSSKEDLIKDLNHIFQQSMASGKLNVALKAKELLLKLTGVCSPSKSIKPIAQWSDKEIEEIIRQLEEEVG